MQQYLDLLSHIMKTGVDKSDRTGTGTRSIFGYQMRFNLLDGFPLVTTKKIHTKSIVHELLWFLKGSTNIDYLKEHGVTIWDEWANPEGELGPIYGKQWRNWPTPDGNTIDQISDLIRDLKKNPNSRRHIVTAWNPGEIPQMALPPCHCLFQFYTRPMTHSQRKKWWAYRHEKSLSYFIDLNDMQLTEAGCPTLALDCQLYQRSCDTVLGVPFNIASYPLLTMMVAQVVDMAPGEFIWTGGDVHIYSNHHEQVELQLSRNPKPLPIMVINPEVKDIFSFTFEDFTLKGYDPHPAIKAPIAV